MDGDLSVAEGEVVRIKEEHNADWVKVQLCPGLPDFSWYKIPKRGKNYQMPIKYTQWLQIFQ
jgi:hypothetical protein